LPSIGAVISIPGSKVFPPTKACATAAPIHHARTTDENGAGNARAQKASKAPEQWLVQRLLKVTNARAPAAKK
jgi:hypothetical protein